MSKIDMRAIKKEAIEEYTAIIYTIAKEKYKRSGSTGFLFEVEESAKTALLNFVHTKE